MGLLADQFYHKTQQPYLTNITHLSNIPSIIQQGLLCYENTKNIAHVSVALEGVQRRRDQKRVPNGLPLHKYASLYFAPRNPMMFRLKCHMEPEQFTELVVLMISRDVLDLEGVVVSDGNAASNVTRFYSPEEGIFSLDFQMIYAKWWKNQDPYIEEENKRVKCAEVLVPYQIPQSMVIGAVVPSEETKEKLAALGMPGRIIVDPNTFFL